MLSAYEQFSVALSSLYQDVQKIQRAEMAQFGLKGSHARCLVALNHYGQGVTATELCQRYDWDKAAVSRTVSELEHRDLVHRELHGESRYRAKLVLTEKGQEIADLVNRAAQRAVERAGDGYSLEQRQIFYSVLGHISENLHALYKDGLEAAE